MKKLPKPHILQKAIWHSLSHKVFRAWLLSRYAATSEKQKWCFHLVSNILPLTRMQEKSIYAKRRSLSVSPCLARVTWTYFEVFIYQRVFALGFIASIGEKITSAHECAEAFIMVTAYFIQRKRRQDGGKNILKSRKNSRRTRKITYTIRTCRFGCVAAMLFWKSRFLLFKHLFKRMDLPSYCDIRRSRNLQFYLSRRKKAGSILN